MSTPGILAEMTHPETGKEKGNVRGRMKKEIAVKETNQTANEREIEIVRGDANVTEIVGTETGTDVTEVTEVTEEIGTETGIASGGGEAKTTNRRRSLTESVKRTEIASVTVDDATGIETVIEIVIAAAGEIGIGAIGKGVIGKGVIGIGIEIGTGTGTAAARGDGIAIGTGPRRRRAGMRGKMKTGRGSLRVKEVGRVSMGKRGREERRGTTRRKNKVNMEGREKGTGTKLISTVVKCRRWIMALKITAPSLRSSVGWKLEIARHRMKIKQTVLHSKKMMMGRFKLMFSPVV